MEEKAEIFERELGEIYQNSLKSLSDKIEQVLGKENEKTNKWASVLISDNIV